MIKSYFGLKIILGKVRPFLRRLAEVHPQVLIIAPLFPETVLALRAVTRPQLVIWAGQGTRRRHEIRRALTDSLDWAGDDRWLLVNNVQALLEAHVRSVA